MNRPMPVKPEKCERCNRVLSKCKCPKRRDDPRIVQVFGRSCESAKDEAREFHRLSIETGEDNEADLLRMPEDLRPEKAEELEQLKDQLSTLATLTSELARNLTTTMAMVQSMMQTCPHCRAASMRDEVQAAYDHDGTRD